MADRAQYATSPRTEVVTCSVANTSYDGSGTIVPLFTAGTNGSRVDAIGWAAQGNSTAVRLSIFLRESELDTWRWIFSFEVVAITVSATQPPNSGGWANIGWILAPGAQLGVAPTQGETFAVHVSNAADF